MSRAHRPARSDVPRGASFVVRVWYELSSNRTADPSNHGLRGSVVRVGMVTPRYFSSLDGLRQIIADCVGTGAQPDPGDGHANLSPAGPGGGASRSGVG